MGFGGQCNSCVPPNFYQRSGNGGSQPDFMADVPEGVLLLPLWRRQVLAAGYD